MGKQRVTRREQGRVRRRCWQWRMRGAVLAEVAFALLGVALFIVAATDIGRLFQARSTVQAGVQEGLRCMYPLDDACGAGSIPAPPSPALFDVWVGQLRPEYAIAQQRLTASATWFTEDVWQVQEERTTVAEATVVRPQQGYQQYQVLYPLEKHSLYLLQLRDLPQVGGTPLTPFFYQRDSDQRISPHRELDLAGVRGSTTTSASMGADGTLNYYDDRRLIGSVSFTLADAWQGGISIDSARAALAGTGGALRCLRGATTPSAQGVVLDWSASTPPADCAYERATVTPLFNAGAQALSIPLMFRVAGAVTSNTQANSQNPGSIVMMLRWQSPRAGSGSMKLGGRLISAGSSGNFVVRGASWGDIRERAKDAYEKSYKQEIDSYGTLPLLPLDATVELSFYLSSPAPRVRVGWTGERLQLFYPSFTGVDQVFPCGYIAERNVCQAGPATGLPNSFVALNQTQPLRAEPLAPSGCYPEPPQPYAADTAAALSAVRAEVLAGAAPQRRTVWGDAAGMGSCEEQRTPYRCSAVLARTHLRGCQPDQWPLQDLLRECAVPAPLPERARVEQRFDAPQPVGMVERRDCSDAPFPSCAAPNKQFVRTELIGPGVSCPSRTAHVSPTEEVGPLDLRSCDTAALDAFQAVYRAKFAIPYNVGVAVDALAAEPRISTVRPTDACLVYQERQRREEVVCGRGLSAVDADLCCIEAGYDCRKVQVQAAGGVPAGSGAQLSAAVQRAVEAVSAGLPQAQWAAQCGADQPYCMEVTADLVDDNTRARLSAQVQVPLFAAQMVGQKSVTIAHQDSRVLERALVQRGK